MGIILILLCSDLHLDDQKANEYRWRVFDELERACRAYPVTRVSCLGDMTDKRDRFPAEMVNRLVGCWSSIVDIIKWSDRWEHRKIDDVLVDILRGNHDTTVSGPAFWEFLSQIPGLDYVTRPTMRDGGLLILPFSPNPREEWRGLVTGDVEAIFLHATRSGTIAENGFPLSGQEMPPIPRRVRVYSGDVHNQQVVGNWTYVGASSPIKFGDDYACRFLLLDEHTYEVVDEVAISTISKRVVEVSSLADLEAADVRSGDQVKVRVSVSPGGIGDLSWAIMEREVERWARERGVEVSSIEGGYEVLVQSGAPGEDLSPEEVLRAFACEEDVSGSRLDVGLELLGTVSGT
jgi:hypothetical protein